MENSSYTLASRRASWTLCYVTAASLENKACIARASYLTVLNVQKATENVDARMRALRDKVSSAHAFFKLETSEWSLDPTATLSASGGFISSKKESIAIERHTVVSRLLVPIAI